MLVGGMLRGEKEWAGKEGTWRGEFAGVWVLVLDGVRRWQPTMSDRKRAHDGNSDSFVSKKLKRSAIYPFCSFIHSLHPLLSDVVSPFPPLKGESTSTTLTTRFYNLFSA